MIGNGVRINHDMGYLATAQTQEAALETSRIFHTALAEIDIDLSELSASRKAMTADVYDAKKAALEETRIMLIKQYARDMAAMR